MTYAIIDVPKQKNGADISLSFFGNKKIFTTMPEKPMSMPEAASTPAIV